jgi:hypothetical protein
MKGVRSAEFGMLSDRRKSNAAKCGVPRKGPEGRANDHLALLWIAS